MSKVLATIVSALVAVSFSGMVFAADVTYETKNGTTKVIPAGEVKEEKKKVKKSTKTHKKHHKKTSKKIAVVPD